MIEAESLAVAELLHRCKNMFLFSDQDLGRTNLVKHHIDTGNARPIKQQPCCNSPLKHAEIERQVEELLHCGIVKESNSPWSSPIVLVTKDGSQRFCVEYQKVNASALKMHIHYHTLMTPRLLSLVSGYWQVPMGPTSSGKAGLYDWTHMECPLQGCQ